MSEQITVQFPERGGVETYYLPESPEAEQRDELRATELALHALAANAVRLRQECGLPVPPVLLAVVGAHTFRELL